MAISLAGIGRLPLIALVLLVSCSPARAQIQLYADHLPAGTVYIRFANALPATAQIETSFGPPVTLGENDAARISPYYVAGMVGGTAITLKVTEPGHVTATSITPKSGEFVTVILHRPAAEVTATMLTDKPEFNQLRAKLTFYNATASCDAGALSQPGGRPIFAAMPPDSTRSRSVNPVTAKLVASCADGAAAPLDAGRLEAGGLYSVWLMRPAGGLISFVSHDTIAPPS
jgi:hypothetical protein